MIRKCGKSAFFANRGFRTETDDRQHKYVCPGRHLMNWNRSRTAEDAEERREEISFAVARSDCPSLQPGCVQSTALAAADTETSLHEPLLPMRLHRSLLPSLCVPPRPLRLNYVRNRSPRIAVSPRRPQRNAEKRSRLRRLNLPAQRCDQTANDRRPERPTLRIPVSPHLCSYLHFAIQPIAAAPPSASLRDLCGEIKLRAVVHQESRFNRREL